jgi:Carboxypeptidase regulatory-like domain
MMLSTRLTQFQSVCFRGMLATLFFCLVGTLCVPLGHAQSTGGRVRGTVTDASGGAVAGVTVSLINTATNVPRQATTNATGEFIFLEVAVGSYVIDINQPGFKKFVRKDINLDLNAVVSVDIALQVGGSTETVEVTGEPPVIDTTTTQLGAVVNSRDITGLPLNARDTYQLLQLQPGVQSQLGNDLFYGSDKPGVVTVNGGRGRSNNYSVNGGDGNDLFANLPAVEPSPDTIEEFRVITNSFDAEYGRNSGAVVNVVTKSGTNDYHGSIFEFFRNKDLNAKGFYDPVKPDFQQNQFGGVLGGPIKKDKTFFFASYEGRRIKQGISSNPVPLLTNSQLTTGNFSGGDPSAFFPGSLVSGTVGSILQARCGSAGTNNVLSAPANAALTNLINNTVTAVPYATLFPNASIPTQCFDPLSTSIYNAYVHPTSDGLFQAAPNKIDNGNQFSAKIDHDLSKNQKLAVYYYFDDDNTLDPFAKFQAAGGNLGNFPGVFATRTQQLNASHTWTIGSTAVNEFRFTYFREGQGKFNSPTVTSDITASCGSAAVTAGICFTGNSDTGVIGGNPDYGIHPGLGPTKEGLPYISVNGGFSLGNNSEGQLPQTGNTFQWSDNFSKIIGTHSFKFGGDIRYQKFDQLLYYNVNGIINFGPGGENDLGGVTTVNPTDPTQTFNSGSSYPNYLLGLPNDFSQGSAQHELVRSTSVYLYTQDSWKIRSNLTLNYGLRWEMNTPLTDIGQKVQTFRPGQVSTIYPCELPTTSPLYNPAAGITDCNSAGVTPVGLVFPGDKGVPKGLTNTYYKAFAPRLGLNYSPSWSDGLLGALTGGPNKSTISGGWGLFYNPIEQLVLEQFSAEPPFGGSNFISDPLFQTPFVTQDGSPNPNPFNGILNPPRGQPLDWSSFRSLLLFGQFPTNLRTQYSAQYNLTLKRELPGNILFQIGYVGSQGHRLLASYDLNHGNPATCNGLQAISTLNSDASVSCGPQSADNSYFVSPSDNIPVGGLTIPYGGPSGGSFVFLPGGGNVGANNGGNGITLVGLRQYSSPLCQPLTGVGCPSDGIPVFSNIFTENTVAHSNYNSLQVLFEKHYSHGLQFQAAYTYSKSLDNASSFENSLNPVDLNSTYGPSLFDARHRFVFSYVWEIPAPKYDGFKGQLLDGWQASGIVTLQTGFPIRITSSDDIEEFYSTFFEAPGEPNLTAPFHTTDPRVGGCAQGTGPLAGAGAPACQNLSGVVFDQNLFTNSTVAPGTIGNAPRSICCQPGIANVDMGFFKGFQLRERLRMEFRTEVYNLFNHTQLYSVDGNISDGSTFGLAQKARDPRLLQFALKFLF